MRISLGMNLQSGPFGGGNQFGHALSHHLRGRGWEVFHTLQPSDLDLILLTEPRAELRISSFSDTDVKRHLRRVSPEAIVVHRVNECDERKGTRGVNRRLRQASRVADHTVFISSWLRDLHLSQGWHTPEHSVILNGASGEIFHSRGHQRWDHCERLRIVTHHWGGNRLKGFDIYERLDHLIGTTDLGNRVEFTYIGNVPGDVEFHHTRVVEPLSGVDLADAIRGNHVYLTASMNEPAGMHHIEGALCGLPLLHRRSGALPEYCHGFGIAFDSEDFPERLEEMIRDYDQHVVRMPSYPHTAEVMCDQYLRLFLDLIHRREDIRRRRAVRGWRQWIAPWRAEQSETHRSGSRAQRQCLAPA